LSELVVVLDRIENRTEEEFINADQKTGHR